METQNIEKKKAQNAFKKANKEVKALLMELFGEKTFSEKITDRVKTYEDACSVLGVSELDGTVTVVDGCLKDDSGSIMAYCKLIIIARALNEGWTPNWEDSNEPKYYPYFKMKAGFGFSLSCYLCGDSHAAVGSRFVFPSEEISDYYAKQFIEIHQSVLMFN